MIIFWTLSLLSSQIYFKKRGGEKKSSEAYIFLEEKYLCTDRPVILWNSIHDSFIGAQPSPPLFLSGKKASLQSGFLSFERSKLHQVDGEVCFTCHSVELPPNEMLHTDFCLRAQGDKTVVTEWNKPLPIPFTHTQTQTHMQNTHPQTHIHAVVYTHTHTLAGEHPCEEIQICNLFKYWYFYLSGERCLEISSEYSCQKNSRKYVR